MFHDVYNDTAQNIMFNINMHPTSIVFCLSSGCAYAIVYVYEMMLYDKVSLNIQTAGENNGKRREIIRWKNFSSFDNGLTLSGFDD